EPHLLRVQVVQHLDVPLGVDGRVRERDRERHGGGAQEPVVVDRGVGVRRVLVRHRGQRPVEVVVAVRSGGDVAAGQRGGGGEVVEMRRGGGGRGVAAGRARPL